MAMMNRLTSSCRTCMLRPFPTRSNQLTGSSYGALALSWQLLPTLKPVQFDDHRSNEKIRRRSSSWVVCHRNETKNTGYDHYYRPVASFVHSTASSSTIGKKLYDDYLEATERLERLEADANEERSKQMYEAWQRSQTKNHDPKTQGVVVVRTLAKQTRKEAQRRRSEKELLKGNALDKLKQAALQHQHPEALVELGNRQLQMAKQLSRDDKRTAEDDSKCHDLVQSALDYFEQAGNQGYRVGWYNLGQLYWTGYPDHEVEEETCDDEEIDSLGTTDEAIDQILAPDMHEAIEAFTKAIDLGDEDAMYLVGVHRMTSGGRENIYSGLNLVEKAAKEGHGGAMYYLAILRLNGEPTIGLEPCTEEEFIVLLDKAVEGGSVDAMFTRGHSYFHGSEGYSQNSGEALKDFLNAAEAGHANSAVSAGAILHTGIGVPKDQRQAFELYQQAGELGSKEGWKNVIACYTTGEGVPKSLETAQYIKETMLDGKQRL